MELQEAGFDQGVTYQPDPCLTQKGSILRFMVLTLLFFVMWGGIVFLILFANRAYLIQISSLVIYTAAVALYTFSRNRGTQPFLLSCTAVRSQVPTLVRRHMVFLTTLFLVQTIALEFRSKLPEHLIAPRGSEPSLFAVFLGVFCGCLAVVQVISNRSLLERAHRSAQGSVS